MKALWKRPKTFGLIFMHKLPQVNMINDLVLCNVAVLWFFIYVQIFISFENRYNVIIAAEEVSPLCGGERIADNTLQYISTPNWPDRYPENTNCLWVIGITDLGYNVRLHFLGINTEIHLDEITVR